MVISSEWPASSFPSGDVFDSTLELYVGYWGGESWLNQANHIFNRLGIISNFEDYGVPDHSWSDSLINQCEQLSCGALISR
jgi:hypothetical protein